MTSERWATEERPDVGAELVHKFGLPHRDRVGAPAASNLPAFASLIEKIIVPRLLESHAREARAQNSFLEMATPAQFADLTMLEEPAAATNYVRRLLQAGMTFDRILLDVMAPAARILGERWVNDECSFVEVTLGVARMHRILREFKGLPEQLWSKSGAGLHILLLPAPGEQHSFGLRLVEEFFLRESWSVTNQAVQTLSELPDIVRSQPYDVIGFSLSGETFIKCLTSAIAETRKQALNRNVKIMIGGHIFNEHPDLVAHCRADAYAVDATEAVRVASQWAQERLAVN